MKQRTQRIIASCIGVPAAILLAGTVYILVADYIAVKRNEPVDLKKMNTLIEAARADVTKGEELAAEYDRQTDESLERKAWHRQYAYVVIGAAVVVLVCGKWFVSVGCVGAPSLSQIRTHRGDASATSIKRRWFRRQADPRQNGQPDVPEIDLTFVDQVVAQVGTSEEASIPILQQIQDHYRYLPDEALKRVCELTEISPAQITGVSTFYSQFRRSPVGKHIVKVCHGTACHVAGAREVTEEVRRRLGIEEGADTDPDRMFTVDEVACLGCCSLAPVIMIDETTAGNLTPATACDAIEAYRMEQPV